MFPTPHPRDTLGRILGSMSRLEHSATRRVQKTVRWATAHRRCLPDFAIIGVQKGGTTSLHNYLLDHPQIRGGFPKKELHFFDLNHARGQRRYRMSFPTRRSRERLESRCGSRLLIGESTPYYFYHPCVPERMASLLPHLKLILLLRNPVDRAISHYFHSVNKGHEHLEIEEAFEREEERLLGESERLLNDERYRSFKHRHFSYLSRGRYAEQLERWLRYYPPHQLLVIPSERLFEDARSTANVVFRFLGCSPWASDIYPKFNQQAYRIVADHVRAKLENHFEPHNRRLLDLLRVNFGWKGETPAYSEKLGA